MNINELTVGQARELSTLFSGTPVTIHPYQIGENYLIRTVTMTLTGQIVAVYPQELVLEKAAWIADTGRFANAVASGDFTEVEPFPVERRVIVGRSAVIDAVQIPKLPRVQK